MCPLKVSDRYGVAKAISKIASSSPFSNSHTVGLHASYKDTEPETREKGMNSNKMGQLIAIRKLPYAPSSP